MPFRQRQVALTSLHVTLYSLPATAHVRQPSEAVTWSLSAIEPVCSHNSPFKHLTQSDWHDPISLDHVFGSACWVKATNKQ